MNDTLSKTIEVVRDTVYIDNTPELINAYQKLIDSQAQTYNLIITVFIGVAALFAGATWLYNRKLAKKDIEETVNDTFEKEKTSFLDGQKLEFKKELNQQKADSSRLFALFNNTVIESTDETENVVYAYSNMVFWWNEVIVHNILSGNLFGERLGVDNLALSLQRVIDKKIEADFLTNYTKVYKYEDLYQTLGYITDSLKSEKDHIYELLNRIGTTAGYDFKNQQDEQKK